MRPAVVEVLDYCAVAVCAGISSGWSATEPCLAGIAKVEDRVVDIHIFEKVIITIRVLVNIGIVAVHVSILIHAMKRVKFLTQICLES